MTRGADGGEEGERIVRDERCEKGLEERRREGRRGWRAGVSVREAIDRVAEVAVGRFRRVGSRGSGKPAPACLDERVDRLERPDEKRSLDLLSSLVGSRVREDGLLDARSDDARVVRLQERISLVRLGGHERVEARLRNLECGDKALGETDAARLLDLAREAKGDEVCEERGESIGTLDLLDEEIDSRLDLLRCASSHVLRDDLDEFVVRLDGDGLRRRRQDGPDAFEPVLRLLELRALDRGVDCEAELDVRLDGEEAGPEDLLDELVG